MAREWLLSTVISLFVTLMIFSAPCAVAAQSEDFQTLQMYYNDADLIVETRTIRPVSVSAEETTIITGEEIRMRSVHTLADLITTLPGVQASQAGGPGSSLVGLSIQGIPASHILVTMDGVTLNDLNDAFPDLAIIPVRIIDRVEIIKGPASSAWGPSTGGVINIYTKQPDEERPIGGEFSGTIGERLTTDDSGEITGTVGDLGYYLSGGVFRTNGFQGNGPVHDSGIYSRLLWTPGSGNRIALTTGWWQSERNAGDDAPTNSHFRDDGRQVMATLSASREMTESSRLSFLLRTMHRNLDDRELDMDGNVSHQMPSKEDSLGASGTYTWQDEIQAVVAGADFDHGKGTYEGSTTTIRNLDRIGLFASDTVTLGDLSITPGLRYDRVSNSGNFLSPSLGLVWRATDHTRIKASVARGYGLPQLVPDLGPGRIFTWQAGFETQEWSPVRFHLHGFFSLVDGNPVSSSTPQTEQHRNRGFEAGFKTMPILHTTLFASLVYVDSRNDSTGALVPGAPRLAADVALSSGEGPVKGLVTGHYLRRNDQPGTTSSSTFLWDITLSGTAMTVETFQVELFLAVHNIFNGTQEYTVTYPAPSLLTSTAGRWVEGGVHIRF